MNIVELSMSIPLSNSAYCNKVGMTKNRTFQPGNLSVTSLTFSSLCFLLAHMLTHTVALGSETGSSGSYSLSH